MRRLSLWMKAHPTFGDSLLSAMLVFVDLLLYLSRYVVGDEVAVRIPWYAGVPIILGVSVPVAFRRRYPVVAAYTTLVFGIPHSVFELGIASLFSSCMALYTLVAYVGRKQAALFVLVNVLSMVVQVPLQRQFGYPSTTMADAITVSVMVVLAIALCWVLGEFVGARRAYHAEVEQRLALLELERDRQAGMAVAAERARIARELHDVVAHAVSVIVVQADGAGYSVRSQPELAERAVATISATGREALTELRRLLGVLRSDDTARDLAPQPAGAGSLNDLAERVRGVGLPVRLEVDGDLDDLPAGVGLGLYRITQEALTNTLKHAGPGTATLVRVVRSGDGVELEVTDEGPGLAPALVGVAGGNGLIGMRERALVFGGSLEAGPKPGGGWRVRAKLPLSPS